jgi:hypothetical protein
MLICDAPRFLFVHVQRTGGTTLDAVLRDALPSAHRYLGTHDFATRARKELGLSFGGYFKFAFVRNPWDRLVSWYEMIVQRSREPGAYQLALWRYLNDNASSFDDFIERCTGVIQDVDGDKSFVFQQHQYLCDEEGRLLVDFVGRFERYEEDAKAILRRLGLAHLELPKLNASVHRDYREYYTPKTQAIVAERFARDIALFGYQF